MFTPLMRLCAFFLLVFMPVSAAWSAESGAPAPAACIGCGTIPILGISSINADDAGGIYNGSNVTLNVTVSNTGTGPGAWQAVLDIPSGYDFIDSNPCGGVVSQPVFCRAGPKSFSGSMYYLSWPDGTDGAGSGDDLAAGASNTCNIRLSVTTATTNDVAYAYLYSAPHYACGGSTPLDSKTYTFQTTTTPTTDMAIAISSGASSVAVGDSVDFTLTASNIGRQNATGASAYVDYPTTLAVTPKNCPGASVTVSDNGQPEIYWNIGNVNYGASATCVLTATAQSGAGTNATMTTNVYASESDPDYSNNSASSTIAIVAPQADLSATISANPNPAAKGNQVTFTLKASNAGPQRATSTQLTGTFPAQLQLNSASCASGTPSNPLVWNIGTLASGANATCSVIATVIDDSVSSVTIRNNVSSATTDSSPANNVANYTLQITPPAPQNADLSAAISASANPAAKGSQVTFTLKASNAGPQSATSTQLTGTFPAQLQLNSASCASGTPSNPLVWNIGTLASGANATCSVIATVIDDSVSSVTIKNNVSSATTDPSPANNVANYTLQITPPTPQSADLAAAISASATSLTPGQDVTFTLKASNLGPASAASAQLTGNFPSQLQLNSASCMSGTPANPLVWNIGTLAASASQICTVQATLSAATTAASITATDSVGSATADSNSGNNSASVMIAVMQSTQVANLAIQLSGVAPGHAYVPGEILHFTVTATNTSSGSDASGVVATVHLPNDGSLTGFNATCGTVDATGKLVWSIGELPRSGTLTCAVTATVATSTRTIALSAGIDAPALGSDLDHLMDALIVPVNARPKQISKTLNGAPTTKNSTHVALNGDGSVAVFQSQETDLVASNANTSGQDVYRVGADGKTVLENTDSAGHQLIGTASGPAVSGDGGIVAFAFAAGAAKQAKDAINSTMWAGAAGQPKHQVDIGMAGAAPNAAASGAPSVASASGSKKLVFCSAASNLAAGDNNSARDVFLVDPSSPGQAPHIISTDNQGHQLVGDSCEPKISADGTKVVFTVSAPSLYGTSARQVVRKDLVTGQLEVLSGTPAGTFANADNSEPAINADGSVVAFTSQASNLDTLGTPVGGREVFLSLAQSGAVGSARTIKRLRSGDGTVPNGASQHAQLSDDGSIVVAQTVATNFFGEAKALGTPACGAVAVTTNFFSPAAMGSSLCNGSTSNQNPAISGNGSTAGFDSNAPQAGTSSINSNAYTQGVAGLNALGTSNFGGDFSGQWYDPNQNGQGLVIDVVRPDANNNRIVLLTWFVYLNGQPSWVQGVGVPQTGSGSQAGMVVVQMDQVAIFKGKSFPLGEANATHSLWGSITLTFTDANIGTMSWTSSYPGFNSGTMAITHFLPVGLPAKDAPGAQVKACYSGNWYNPAQTGHGFEFEVIPSTPPVLAVDWFAYGPTGTAVWLAGAGPISGNTAQVPLAFIDGAGAQFPPLFDAAGITQHLWGTATFTFTDAGHATVTWNSTIPGYGSGTQPLQPLVVGLLDRRGCQ